MWTRCPCPESCRYRVMLRTPTKRTARTTWANTQSWPAVAPRSAPGAWKAPTPALHAHRHRRQQDAQVQQRPRLRKPNGRRQRRLQHNTYEVTLKVTDSSESDIYGTFAVTVSVTDVDELGALSGSDKICQRQRGRHGCGHLHAHGDRGWPHGHLEHGKALMPTSSRSTARA